MYIRSTVFSLEDLWNGVFKCGKNKEGTKKIRETKNRQRKDEKGLRGGTSLERGVTCPGLFFRVANCTLSGKEWRLSPDCSVERMKSTSAWVSSFVQRWTNSWMHAIVVNLKSHFSGFSFFFFYLLLFIFFFFSRFVSFLFRVKIQGQNRKEEVKIACYPTVPFFFFFR